MTVFPAYASPELDPAERGRAFGARWPSSIAACVAGYEELFRAYDATQAQVRGWAETALERTAAWAPQLAVEIEGIAAGAGVEPWQVAALNARTEILAPLRDGGDGECSTVVVLPESGPPRTIQTWDWRDRMRDVPVLWTYQPGPDRVVRAFTEFGVLGKIGVNSAGVGVHFNILRHGSDHAEIGVPVHVVARRILDEATDVAEATEIARSARTSASTVITVVDFDGVRGRARALEVCPRGVGVVPAEADGVLLHTNHFLDPDLSAGERLGPQRPGTYARLKHLRARVDDLRSDDPTARAEAMLGHGPDGAPVCAHADPAEPFHERSETLATISLDLAGHRLLVHRGGPCQVTAATWQTF